MNALSVPYFSQRDNASGSGYRECFSSSCAMLAAYWGKVTSDDAYNQLRARFGDTTSAEAQLRTLRALGLMPRFISNASPALLEAEITAGRPVAVGWLHVGPASAPRGGGHWSVAIGQDADAFIHNDPNGEADLVGGGYLSAAGGAGVRYSRRNWLRRWEADGPGTGWAITVAPLEREAVA